MLNRSSEFVLEGIGGVYNYGCEAIVRGTAAILRRYWPCCTVRYCSHRPESDAVSLKDAPVHVSPHKVPIPFFERARLKVARTLRLPATISPAYRIPWIGNGDCVLQIGGDILTLGPEQRTATEFFQVNHLNALVDTGKPIVLWGASIGPFDENPCATEAFGKALNRLALITVREPETARYLSRIGVTRNVAEVADPAFLMPAAPCSDDAIQSWLPREGRRTLAVNLSPHAVHYSYHSTKADEAIVEHAQAVAGFVTDCDADILLVPHVICPGQATDDDPAYLQALFRQLPESVRDKVRLLPPNLGAMRTKAVLSACDAVVAARMHCAIAGISSGVPTLLLSYSAKALGMCEFVYGNRDFVLPVNSGVAVLVSRVKRLLEQGTVLREQLEAKQAWFKELALAGGAALCALWRRPEEQIKSLR